MTASRCSGRIELAKVAVRYSTIREVQVYKVRYLGSRATYWRCVLRYGSGGKTCLQAAHFLGFRQIEDQTPTYIPFIKKLEARIAEANPTAVFREGRPWLAYWDAALGAMFVLAQKATRLVSLNSASDAFSWLMRMIGPRLKGQRIARANLAAAYPEKSREDINVILRGMWDNVGRLFVEYAHLDHLWDFDPDGPPGRISVDDATRRRFVELRDSKGPFLLFGAHLANWELLPWAAGCHRGEATILYRAPKIASIERELAKLRAGAKVDFIPASVSAIFKINKALRRGAILGLLVDEHFARGIDVMFFGRPCKATPIPAQLARRFDCPLYGARMIRLAGGRFRLDITEPIHAPRDPSGRIDVAAATQLMTTVIEGWIRENPGQWLWLQRRWR